MAYTVAEEDIVREINKRLSLCLVQGPGNTEEAKRQAIVGKLKAALDAQPKDPRQDLRGVFASLRQVIDEVDANW